MQIIQTVKPPCCRACFKLDQEEAAHNGQLLFLSLMVLCPQCGNKRCPQAQDHNHECTGSNDLNQKGVQKC